MIPTGAPIQAVPDNALKVYSLPIEKQAYVMAIHEGKTLTDSYLAASPDCDRASAATMGSRWFKRVEVREAIDELSMQRTYDSFRLLRSGQRKAIGVVLNLVNGKGGGISQDQLRACLEVLDRTGVSSKHIIGLEASKTPNDGFDGFLNNCTKPST